MNFCFILRKLFRPIKYMHDFYKCKTMSISIRFNRTKRIYINCVNSSMGNRNHSSVACELNVYWVDSTNTVFIYIYKIKVTGL